MFTSDVELASGVYEELYRRMSTVKGDEMGCWVLNARKRPVIHLPGGYS
jgi:hypothetical protein